MITKEECMEIRILSRQGKSIREIKRITGHSGNTIRKFLRSAAKPAYKERGPGHVLSSGVRSHRGHAPV
jgi:transposase